MDVGEKRHECCSRAPATHHLCSTRPPHLASEEAGHADTSQGMVHAPPPPTTSLIRASGFRVQGSGFRVQVSGFRVQGSGFRVQGSGFRGWGLGVGARRVSPSMQPPPLSFSRNPEPQTPKTKPQRSRKRERTSLPTRVRAHHQPFVSQTRNPEPETLPLARLACVMWTPVPYALISFKVFST